MSAVVAEDVNAVAGSGPRLLFVVARTHLGLYRQLARAFDGGGEVETILDRRTEDRRGGAPSPTLDRRSTERRATPGDEHLDSHGWFITWRAPSRRQDGEILAAPAFAPRSPIGDVTLRPPDLGAIAARIGAREPDASTPGPRRTAASSGALRRLGILLLAGLCATALLYATARMWTARARPAGTDTGPLAIPTAVEPAAPVTSAAPSPAATAQSIDPVGAAEPPAAPPGNTVLGRPADLRREVRAAFAGWIDSTNRGHVASHIEWYADPVPVFYNAKNVSRSAVLTLRRKTFAEANRIEVRTNEPEIRLAGDEITATMVFRRTYRFEGPRTDRRGAVFQELTWRKTNDGWRIIGERTLRELPSEPSGRPKRP